MQSLNKAVLYLIFCYRRSRNGTRSLGKIIRFTFKPAFPGLNKRIFCLSPEIYDLILAKTADFGNNKIMLKKNDIKNQQNLDRL